MISNKSKIGLGVFLLSLVVMLFVRSTLAGLISLSVTGILALVTAIFLAHDIKKLDSSLRSKILSVLLTNTIVYSTAWTFFWLSRMDLGDMGLLVLFPMVFGSIFIILSVTEGILLVVRNKDITSRGNPNKILALIALFVLIIMTYLMGSLVTSFAELVQNPALCSLQTEAREREGGHRSGFLSMQDTCIYQVAKSTLDVNYCEQIKGSVSETGGIDNQFKDYCVRDVAIGLRNTNVCSRSTNPQAVSNCVFGVGFTN